MCKLMSKNKQKSVFAISIISIIAIILVVSFHSPFYRIKRQLSLGNKYLEDLKFEDALYAFRAAIETEPTSVEGYIGLAEAYIKLGRFPEARNELIRGKYLTKSDLLLEKYIYVLAEDRKHGKRIKKAIIKHNDMIVGEELYFYSSDGFLESIRKDFQYTEPIGNGTSGILHTGQHVTVYYSDYDSFGNYQHAIQKYNNGTISTCDWEYTYYDYFLLKEYTLHQADNYENFETQTQITYTFDPKGFLKSRHIEHRRTSNLTRRSDGARNAVYDENGYIISDGDVSFEHDEYGYITRKIEKEMTYEYEYETPNG